jgi:hypothetical protein
MTDAEIYEIVDEMACNGPRATCQGCNAEWTRGENGSLDHIHAPGCWIVRWLNTHPR